MTEPITQRSFVSKVVPTRWVVTLLFLFWFVVATNFGIHGWVVAAPKSSPSGYGYVSVSAASAVVMDAATGEVIFAKNADVPRPMASTTKIMTAILVLEEGNLAEKVQIDWNSARTEGSSLYTKPGEVYSVRDLLYGLMLRSGNDTAVALAQHIAGSVNGFVALMNQKAQELGLKNTRFANPHGLPAENHYTTAYELAELTRYALHNPEFAALVACKTTTIERPSVGPTAISNKNKLLWEYGADGVKTGYTRAAGRCLVASATRNGRQLISVVLNAPDMWTDSKRLLDFGFQHSANIHLVKSGEAYKTVPVLGGETEEVALVAAYDWIVTVPTNREVDWKLRIVSPRQLEAPVHAMQPVGYIQVTADGAVVKEIPLVAANTIPRQKSWWERLFERSRVH